MRAFILVCVSKAVLVFFISWLDPVIRKCLFLPNALNSISPFKEGEKDRKTGGNVSDYLLIKRVNEVCKGC